MYPANKLNELGPDDDLTPVMVYLPQRIIWGKLLHKKTIRVSTWLKMPLVPVHFRFFEANQLFLAGGQPVRLTFDELHVPVSMVLAFHILPPAEGEKDYDPNEPNRRWHPVSVFMDIFQFDGLRRISTLSDLSNSLSTSNEKYASVYEVTISYPTVPSLKKITTPFILVRADQAIIAERPA